jgi:subtilase family serine protease
MNTLVHRLVLRVHLVAAVLLVIPGGIAAQTASSAAQITTRPVARITQAIDNTQLIRLRGNVHPLARPEFDRGAVADSMPMNRMLLLLQRSAEQKAALQKLLEEQQIKGSPNFHKWLTPDEFGNRFGPADADIQKITDWLASQGFQNFKVGAGRTAIEFSGNVGMVRSAFHTGIHKFNVNGQLRQANVSDPEIPAALAPVVAGVVSLNNFPRRSYRHTAGVFQQTAEGKIASQMTTTTGCGTGGNSPCYVVGPWDFAKIYSSDLLTTATPPVDGSGVKIAIVGISNINVQDVTDFRSLFGLPTNPPNIILDGPDPGLNSAEGEGDLDVEWSGAVAPGATIDFIVSEDTLTALGTDLSSFYVIDNNSDDIMSLSFGACESALGTTGNAFYNSLWEQAAAQGITVTVAAGDPGSAGCDDFTTATRASNGLAVSGLASTPFNIAVGGTDFDEVGTQTNFWNSTNSTDGKRESAKGYIPETTWNDSCAATATTGNLTTCVNPSASSLLNIVAGAGGPSAVNPKPSWQAQSGLTPADSHRDTPDVSLFASDGPASNSFYLMCQADALPAGSSPSCNPAATGKFSFFGVGGTSASTPAFAGIMALIDQEMGGRQGNANVILYKIAQGENFSNCNSTTTPLSPSCAFYDITKGNNSVPCAGDPTNTTNCSSTTTGTNGVLVDPKNPTTPAWTTKTGYDFATGLGSVNVANLAAAWPTAVSTFTGTTTTLAANGSTTITHGQSVSFTATVAPNAGTGTPTGDISLLGPTGTTNSGGNVQGLTNGTTTISTTFLPGGTYSVKAHYGGDTTFAPSDSNSISVTVAKENSHLQMGIVTFSLITGAITSTNATSFEYGSPYILRMDILNSTGTSSNCQPLVNNGVTTGCAFDATGSVTITDNGNPLDAGAFPLNSLGHAEDQPIQLPAGTLNLSANYSGDVSYNPSGPVTASLTVTKATTTTAVTPSVTTIVSGGTVTLTATVNSNSNSSAGPSGTVQFLSNGSNLGAATTCTPAGATSTAGASCTAKLTTAVSSLPPGLFETPQQNPPQVLIWLAALCALICLLLALRLPARRRGYAYAGLVVFLLMAGGLSGCSGSGSSSNSHMRSITAQYGGDANYAASTSSAVTITLQ